MGVRLHLPDGDRLRLAERLFDAVSTFDWLTRSSEPPGRRKIAPSRLYAYATDARAEVDVELERALDEDAEARAAFRRLLEKTAHGRMPRVAAASSGPILSRDGQGCRIRFERSRAEPNQTYVIIELTDKRAPPPATLFVWDREDRCRRYPLPLAQEGVIQMLVEQESDLLQGLLDIKSEVFLR